MSLIPSSAASFFLQDLPHFLGLTSQEPQLWSAPQLLGGVGKINKTSPRSPLKQRVDRGF